MTLHKINHYLGLHTILEVSWCMDGLYQAALVPENPERFSWQGEPKPTVEEALQDLEERLP